MKTLFLFFISLCAFLSCEGSIDSLLADFRHHSLVKTLTVKGKMDARDFD